MRKLCSAPGCDDLAIAGQTRCADHAAAALAKRTMARAAAKTSADAIARRAFYSDPRWRRGRREFLRLHPLCVDCAELGVVRAATEVDHKERHLGDAARFWDRSNWQALCKSCHSRKTAREVWHGGVVYGYSIPHNQPRSVVPVTLVGGPPAAGKTTYVNSVAGPEDMVIDLDDYIRRLGGQTWETDRAVVAAAFRARDADLRRLGSYVAPRVWIVLLGADPFERRAWLEALGSFARWEIIAPPRDVVLAQMLADPVRRGRMHLMEPEIARWYALNH